MATRRSTPYCFCCRFAAAATCCFLLAALHARPSLGQEDPPPWLLCGVDDSGNYTANGTYQSNINRLSATLPKNTSSSPVLYANDSAGSIPDRVYALAVCRRDANASACGSCVAAAFAGAQRECPLVKDVLIFYDLCQLRFSNRMFFLDEDNFITATYVIGAPISGGGAVDFDAAVSLLVNATADSAAGNASRRFATGEMGFDGESNHRKIIYALAQCTPDNRVAFCRTCLGQIVNQLPKYFSGRNGGGIFGTWCTFRYEMYSFFSGRPQLQLPAFMATPPARAPAPELPATRNQGKSRNKTGIVLKFMMPIIAALLAATVICFWRRKKRRSAARSFQPYSDGSGDIQGADMLLLDLSTLRVATYDFAESKILGKGGFGIVYKGVLPDGQEIAVKRLSQSSRQGIGELKSELVLVAKLHHKNLVRLVGVCLQEHEKILVYEYIPNKSLDTILFDPVRNTELDWGKRFKIINGIARGLQYLHEDSQLKIVHRDLKASNILLDSDYVPKISDFGLAKIFGGDQSKYVTHRVAGTYGYMAPEYAMRGLYSIKSDVFSFGVLLLEIVTGRRNTGSNDSEQDVDLLNLVWGHWNRGNVVGLIDPSLSDHPPIEQVLKCIHIGLLCVQRKPAARPMMSWVNVMLSSSTVRLPSLSRPAFYFQEVSASDSSSDAYLAERPRASECTESSPAMSHNNVSITELVPR